MSNRNKHNKPHQNRPSSSNRRRLAIAICFVLILPGLFIGLRVAKAYYSIDLPRPRVNDEIIDHMYTCVLDRAIGGGDATTRASYLDDLNTNSITIDQLYLDYFAIADSEAGGGGLSQHDFLDRAYRCVSFHTPDQDNFDEWDGLFEYYTHAEMIGFFQSDYGYNNIIEPALAAAGPLKIAFETDRDTDEEVYNMDFNASNQTDLTNNAYQDRDPSLSPDRGKIAFESNRSGAYEIYSMPWDGGTPTNLTNNNSPTGFGNDQGAAWSPDGTKIAFFTDREAADQIYVMNANGTSQVNLTNTAGSFYNETSPAWSADGTKIYFVSDRDGDQEIFVMDADGTDQTQLTFNGFADDDPDCSPDGTTLVFRSKRDHSAGEIYTMNLGSGTVTRLTNNTKKDASPNYSFYGTQIIFESTRDTGATGNEQLYTMDANGSNQTRLTNNSDNDRRADW